MTGLVVVCHSRPLARAAVALATEMTRGRPLQVEIAAGLDEDTYGTDAVAIMEAVVAADDGDGVVVLMDLGSAVLSAETALELLDPDVRDRVVLCPGPLVEGLVAAAVAAASGAGRSEVAAEALAGLAGKESHLGVTEQDQITEGTQGGPSAKVRVTDPHGLHARPAARVVGEARSFDARVELRNATTGSGWVPASSLSKVATLGVLQGHEVEVRASGAQAQEAVARVAAVAGSGSGLSTGRALSTGASQDLGSAGENGAGGGPQGRAGAVAGAASPGVAIGPAARLRAVPIDVPDVPSLGVEPERQRLDRALDQTRRELTRISDPIFDAHLLLLDDLDPEARTLIGQAHPAPQAWQQAVAAIAADFDALPDPYLRGRAADVRAVGDQVLRFLVGAPAPTLAGDGVLIAADLTPAEAATLDPTRIAGVLLAAGSPTSHAAILTRTRGIPAVVGAGPQVLDIRDGTLIALDGGSGEIAVAPADAVLDAFRARAAEQRARSQAARSRAIEPAVTTTGVPIAVGANVGSVEEARAAAANGADLAGLVRTEFLFQDRTAAPDVDEQLAVYRAIAAAFDGRRVTLRTLDAGSDKPVPFLPAPPEANPFLGVRGLRLSLAHPTVFAAQLQAIALVAREAPISVMFPMVTTVGELRRARMMLDEALARTGSGRPADLRVGMMVEVPAAALRAADFVPYADFFSVGTNDLTQYTLAAERGNAALMSLSTGLDPSVAQLIDLLCRAAGDRVPVAVCGEVAADEQAVPRLLASGVRQLSVAPALVPLVKQAVRAT
ncbi:phosphoenolpyruvate--protein phosphotransferase [Paractinoplanes atraurantiacus]|uniref:Phosphocarrier protein HPr n=1 Tax=Paractinoplanes atraurantiacus TaxID=1036182 RepID=A0A285H549_9ACTN|nr:phosphoenolpyruvate--protein phosphotransferase [Actinoplanes atraurantiacus]SNY30868.1 phosphocarrier protein FPr [Actinoplanes atraurantiacus]